MFSKNPMDMTPLCAAAPIGWRALSQRAMWGLSMLCLCLGLVACGGGGGSSPRFTWDATTSVLKDSTTGLYWTGVAPGSTPTSGQRLPTVDELLLLTDKATLSDMPTQFSNTLLNNDVVFASDSNYSAAGAQWAVSFLPVERGALYVVRSSDTPADGTAKQPMVVSGSAAAFNRNRADSNYVASTTNRYVIYDVQNDLSWKMCSEGVAFSTVTCSSTPTPTLFSLSQLTQFLAANRTDGWRLPTKYELEGLLDRSRGFEASNPSYLLNTNFFDIGTANNAWWDATSRAERAYWTATQDATGANNFVVSFADGTVRQATTVGSSYYVRLVRSGKY
jgi:hypothetical protein